MTRQAITQGPAPELQVLEWLNTPKPIRLADLRGRVVVRHAFQMRCPGGVLHGLPQATKIHDTFSGDDVAVIGLHTVFEHHEAMNPAALRVFVHEYRLRFPIGIDQASPHQGLPLTMRALALEGTPSLVLIDRRGDIRLQHFGRIDDLALGAWIGQLMAEPAPQGGADGAP